MFRRLRNRLLVFNMTIISLVMIVAFAVIYLLTYTNVEKEDLSKLDSVPRIVHMARSTVSPEQPSDDIRQFEIVSLVRVPVDYSPSFRTWVDDQGKIVDILSFMDMPDDAYQQLVDNAWNAAKPQGTVSYKSKWWRYRVLPNDRSTMGASDQIYSLVGDYQIAFLDVTDSKQTLAKLLVTLILVGLGMLGIIFGISWSFANRSIRPLEDNWQKQKQFVADASHELKTPLAIISANADALLADGQAIAASQAKWIDYIQFEVGRMGALVNDMLYLAKIETASMALSPCNLSQAALDAVASMEVLVFEKGIRLQQTIEPSVVVKADNEKLERVVLILLDNAVKYTNTGGSISVSLRRTRSEAVCTVQNSGTGIPKDKLPHIFDRFYRCDSSRSTHTGGYGLGLAIAKAIVERAGGHIRASSNDESTTLTFELPLA